MQKNLPKMLNDVAAYYAEKLAVIGDTPKRVDWNCEDFEFTFLERNVS